jgi:integrase
MKRKKKTPKGVCAVQLDKDRLRLYWRHEGRKCFLYLGLPDSKINRTVAEQKASQITIDLATGNYDPTLEKYRLQPVNPRGDSLTVSELYRRFWDCKKKTEAITTERSGENYRYATLFILRYAENDDLAVSRVSEDFVHGFLQWAKKEVSHGTLATYLVCIKAIWKYGKISPNPWEGVTVKPYGLKPPSEAFTFDEVHRVIEAFQNHPKWSCYADFVRFLLCSGVRIGEACGLLWENVSEDCSRVWIGQCLTRTGTRPVKTGKARSIRLSPALTELLLSRREERANVTGYVFLSHTNKPITPEFRRIWQRVLTESGIPYRRPYLCRKTFVSHALSQGINPVDIAKLAGHDVNVLYKHYAGVINKNLSLPEVY